MEDKFRPIQVSIIDFLGVIVPGLVWLLLVATGLLMFTGGLPVATPLTTWRYLAKAMGESNVWMGTVGLLLAGMVLGYTVKPKAMRAAGFLALPLTVLHKRLRRIPWSKIEYPYRAVHEDQPFYPILTAGLTDLMGCDVLKLPGNQPFTTAKRFLRVSAPRLWEECEHLEAEVRLIGALFAASVFSLCLAVLEVVRHVLFWQLHANAVAWMISSLVAAIVLGDGFNHMRLREVEYAYLHTLLTRGIAKQQVSAGERLPR